MIKWTILLFNKTQKEETLKQHFFIILNHAIYYDETTALLENKNNNKILFLYFSTGRKKTHFTFIFLFGDIFWFIIYIDIFIIYNSLRDVKRYFKILLKSFTGNYTSISFFKISLNLFLKLLYKIIYRS